MISGLARVFSSNKKIRDLIFWPLTNKVLARDYSEIISFGDNLKIKVYQDIYDMTNKSIMLLGEGKKYPWEPQTSELFLERAKGKTSILIAGGHLGYYALLAARANPEALIYVFEPTKKLFDRLVFNVQLNHLKNIVFEHKALSKIDGRVEIVVDGAQSSLIKHTGNISKDIEMVQGIRIDSYFSTAIRKPELILLDIEGYEMLALEGADDVLSQKPELILEINEKMLKRAGTSSGEMYNMLESRGYTIEPVEDSKEGPKEMSSDCFNIFCRIR